MKKKPDYDQYKDVTMEQLLCDAWFQDWVIGGGDEHDRFWNDWITKNPDRKEMLEQARQLLGRLRFAEHLPSEQQVQRSLQSSLSAIEKQEAEPPAQTRRLWRRLPGVWKVAAAFAGAAIVGSLVYFAGHRDRRLQVATPYATLKTITLPDSSQVVLNAHSAITIKGDWTKKGPREVWLEGEAFFKVRHLNQNGRDIQPFERFVVHTADVSVEVLGTSFDIRQRRGVTEIVLQTGRIKVHFDKGSRPDMIMQPGELVSYNPSLRQVKRDTVVAENYAAWTEQKLVLEDPSLRQIADYLEDNYGKKIIIANKALADKRIEGPILLDNLQDALFLIAVTLNIEIIHKDSILIFKPK